MPNVIATQSIKDVLDLFETDNNFLCIQYFDH